MIMDYKAFALMRPRSHPSRREASETEPIQNPLNCFCYPDAALLRSSASQDFVAGDQPHQAINFVDYVLPTDVCRGGSQLQGEP